MSYNDRYWKDKDERAKLAIIHTDDMNKRYEKEINSAVKNTILYKSYKDISYVQKNAAPQSVVLNMDTVSALFYAKPDKEDMFYTACVLNFASYKNPGGMFIKGSKAQEECLCHESFLYNVLKEFDSVYYGYNRENLNRALYTDRALYSPNIIFEHEGGRAIADVITCAAPNYTAFAKCQNMPEAELRERNTIALRSRIRFISNIVARHNIHTLILGAFGCGVFGQDPAEVSQIFKEEFACSNVARIVYAVPAGMDRTNFKAFADRFKQ